MPSVEKILRKLFYDAGYELIPEGKGSHWKLKKKWFPNGLLFLIIRNLKKGTEHALRKILEVNQI